jgi:hypothetical protein
MKEIKIKFIFNYKEEKKLLGKFYFYKKLF